MKLFLALTALLLTPLAALHAEEASPIQISDRAVIFAHTSTDPKAPANTSGFNHGPSIAVLPDGRVMAVWFSSPSEGAATQRIMQAFSADQGRTWGEATVLQDFEGQADFDPAIFAAGKETFLFFAAVRPQIDVYFRQSRDSAKTWTEPVKLGQSNHTTRANGIQLSTGELLAPLHLRGTKGGGVMKSRDGGKTWTRFGAVKNPDGQGGEPTIAETKSGAIHMIMRTKDGHLWRSISRDKGETWGATEKTGLASDRASAKGRAAWVPPNGSHEGFSSDIRRSAPHFQRRFCAGFRIGLGLARMTPPDPTIEAASHRTRHCHRDGKARSPSARQKARTDCPASRHRRTTSAQ